MRNTPSSSSAPPRLRSWRRLALGAAASLAVAVPVAVAGTSTAGATTTLGPPPGKQSSFTEKVTNGQYLDGSGEIFSWEHDPEALGHNTYTWFDNESAGTPQLPYSRVVTVKLNPATHVATLVSSIDQPEGLSAASQGNAQTEPDGNVLVGWGILPYISEFDPTGGLIYNAQLPSGVNTYRAFRLPWPPAAS